ncbi:MAG: hypothetical protein QNJ29_13200 [Rhizobiaceae bacterium]|nr:hypothetical protein [Rhizobiaceae bacterium]
MNVKKCLEERRTYKIIGTIAYPTEEALIDKDTIDDILKSAGNAPFHYPCDRVHMDTLSSPVPWRCYKLDTVACHELMHMLLDTGDATKVPNMLAAAQYLLQVTWLPDPGTFSGESQSKEDPMFSGTLRNMEHIAAASAFAQSLLLAAEEAGFKTYWSSGGPLRKKPVFDALGIPHTELLLGSIFLFPNEPKHAEIKSGNLADKRGAPNDWSRWCAPTKV